MYVKHEVNSLPKRKSNLKILIERKKQHTWIMRNVIFFSNTIKREKKKENVRI